VRRTDDAHDDYPRPGRSSPAGGAPAARPGRHAGPGPLDDRSGHAGGSAPDRDEPYHYDTSGQLRQYETGNQVRYYDTGSQLRQHDTDQLWRLDPVRAANRLPPTIISGPPATELTTLNAGQAGKSIVAQTRSNPRERVRGMNAALTSGEAGVGEFKPARSPLRPRQFIIAVIAVGVGTSLAVLSYRAVARQPTSFSGQVTPAHAYYLDFLNNGPIQTVTVRPGQSVQTGQVLATQNDSVGKARLGADEATVKADQATLAQDETLLQQGAKTTTPATIAAAQASLASAQAQLVSDQSAVTQSEIIAPASGIVADVTGEPGDFAGPSGVRGFSGPAAQPGTSPSNSFPLFVGGSSGSAGGGSSSAAEFQAFITLYTEPLTVTAQIPQQNITGVHVGQRATLRFPTLSKPVNGTVELIIGAPVRSSAGTFYDVVISIGADQAQMTPGMTVNVTLG
jgi:multidrug efflux pump subunit AcrA (membrane-fusion protein)